jgi:uncharacterized membrane protein YkoI
MKSKIFRLVALSVVLFVCFIGGCKKQLAEKAEMEAVAQEPAEQAEIPQVIMDALKAKFPEALIDKWTREKEGDIVVYDIEFKQLGQKFEADIKEDGSVHNWEQAIAAEDLPEAVKLAAEKAYPNAALEEIMMIKAVVDGQDAVEGYEIVLQTADEKEVEITVAPDGTVLEDSGRG